MTYNPNIPQPNDLISDSQSDILDNFTVLNDVFNQDHVQYTNGSNEGKHKQVTTIDQAAHPSTSGTENKFYSYLENAQLGLVQYARGPSDAKPSPITKLHAGPLSFSGSEQKDILDFANFTYALCVFYCISLDTLTTTNVQFISFNQSTGNFSFDRLSRVSSSLEAQADTGITTKLVIKNGSGSARTNVYWTLEFLQFGV